MQSIVTNASKTKVQKPKSKKKKKRNPISLETPADHK